MSSEPTLDEFGLMPCRMCGSRDNIIDQFSTNDNRWVRECNTCDYMTETCETQAEATALWNARPTAPAPTLPDDVVKHMVQRFLGWKLPANFNPDAGISFQPEFNVEWNAKRGKPPQRHEPTGTNLFDAAQAEAMVRYMLEGMRTPPLPDDPHGFVSLSYWSDGPAKGTLPDDAAGLVEPLISALVYMEPDWSGSLAEAEEVVRKSILPIFATALTAAHAKIAEQAVVLRYIRDADPGPTSNQSLAHDMARVAAQSLLTELDPKP